MNVQGMIDSMSSASTNLRYGVSSHRVQVEGMAVHAVWFIRNTVKFRLDPVLLCVSYFLIVKLDNND